MHHPLTQVINLLKVDVKPLFVLGVLLNLELSHTITENDANKSNRII